MKYAKNKTIIILLLAFICSFVFYISQLFYVSLENEKSSKIYVQALLDSIDRYENLPLLIAEHYLTQEVFNGNSEDVDASNSRLKSIALATGADDIYLMDKEGTVIASSNYDSPNSFLNKNYAFRPYFKAALNEQTRQFYYAKGATTGIPGFFISTPININGVIHGVAVVKLELSYWEESWRDTNEQIIVADQNNIILLSTKNQWRYQSIGDINQDTLSQIKQQQQFPEIDHENIYSKTFNWPFFGADQNRFWIIDRSLYLVNRFELPKTQWHFYYLENHDSILNTSIAVFLFILFILSLVYLLIKGRIHIEESKKKHNLLQIKHKEDLEAIINNTHIGIIITDINGQLTATNDYAKELFIHHQTGLDNQSINIDALLDLNEPLSDFINRQDNQHPETLNYVETAITGDKKPEIPIMYSIKKIQLLDDDVYLLTIINISKRKLAEEKLIHINESLEDIIKTRTDELKKAQHKIIQQNKVSALGNMAATIVHELSQPLTAMNSSIGAIRAKLIKQDYDGAINSANRLEPLNHKMHSVIKLLKSFSYEDDKPSQAINIETLIKNSIESYNDLFHEKEIKTQLIGQRNDLFVKANKTKIDLVFSNIIQNAIDAVEENTQKCIWIELVRNQDTVYIHITDNGKGVTEITMKQMFSPYFTTKEIGKGLGLGLAICYEIIQEYEGNITATSIDGNTCFTIELPLANDIRPLNNE